MTVTYDAAEKPGRQFSVVLDDGRSVNKVSQATAEGILRKTGLSVRQAAAETASARLATVA